MAESNSALASSSLANSVSLPGEDNIEIHPIDTNAWIIFDSEIDVFLDSKPKVTSGGEVSFLQFIFSHLESIQHIHLEMEMNFTYQREHGQKDKERNASSKGE